MFGLYRKAGMYCLAGKSRVVPIARTADMAVVAFPKRPVALPVVPVRGENCTLCLPVLK